MESIFMLKIKFVVPAEQLSMFVKVYQLQFVQCIVGYHNNKKKRKK